MITQPSHLPLAVVGCDFRVASSRIRGQLVLDEGEAMHIAAELVRGKAADGFLDLATCNRNEWYVSSDKPAWAVELLRTWMLDRLGSEHQRRIRPYMFVGEEAAAHFFRVSLGQESLIVGERQIAGQVFRALEAARARGSSSRILNGLGSIAGRSVHNASRCGCLASTNRGVHSLAVNHLRGWLDGRRAKVAVIGLGEIGRRVRGLLSVDAKLQVVPCNRTVLPDQAETVRPLSELTTLLGEVDAAIVCTGALDPTVRPEHLARRQGRPILIVDIGIPEQVLREGLPGGVSVAGIDELVAAHQADAVVVRADQEAQNLLDGALLQFRRFCNEPDFLDILEAVQRRSQAMLGDEIPRIVHDHFGELDEATRQKLEAEIRTVLQSYTHEVFGTIKDAALKRVDGGGYDAATESAADSVTDTAAV
ncbi:MAG: hypothetical protein ABIJ09_13805 [Pseudomonadota bacterium]